MNKARVPPTQICNYKMNFICNLIYGLMKPWPHKGCNPKPWGMWPNPRKKGAPPSGHGWIQTAAKMTFLELNQLPVFFLQSPCLGDVIKQWPPSMLQNMHSPQKVSRVGVSAWEVQQINIAIAMLICWNFQTSYQSTICTFKIFLTLVHFALTWNGKVQFYTIPNIKSP